MGRRGRRKVVAKNTKVNGSDSKIVTLYSFCSSQQNDLIPGYHIPLVFKSILESSGEKLVSRD